MFKKILIATDGSPDGDKAVSVAGEIARAFGAEIFLLHALPDIINDFIPEGYRELAAADHIRVGDVLNLVGNEILKRAHLRLRTAGTENVKIVSARGPAAQAILDYSENHSVDLIVMGCRGLSAFEQLILGSVSQKVSQLANCNCLVVR